MYRKTYSIVIWRDTAPSIMPACKGGSVDNVDNSESLKNLILAIEVAIFAFALSLSISLGLLVGPWLGFMVFAGFALAFVAVMLLSYSRSLKQADGGQP